VFTLWLGYSLIEIHDNFLPDDFADEIENLLMSNQFGWYVNLTTTYANDNLNKIELDKLQTKNVIENSQLVHSFYFTENDGSAFLKDGVENSDYCNLIFSIMDVLKTNTFWKDNPKLIKSKANLNFSMTNYTNENHQPIHSDVGDFKWNEEGCKSLLYYVNDSDGDTIFFDNELNITTRVSPKKNRSIIFDSHNLHAGSNPIKNHMRAVINLVFKWR